EIIEVVEDEEEIEETVIESTETSVDEEIVDVEEVEVFEEEEELADVPFAVIENVPIFPGCESMKSNDARKKCMSEKVSKLVNRKFNTELGGELGLSGINKIFVQFKIDKSGNITNIRSRAPHPRLQKEAERVIKLLPKMTPGKQRGKPVGVLYSLPITFKVED
ncbi:MAG: protein TonB, partial [Dokdonia sp.]